MDFCKAISTPDKFIITMELVPGSKPTGRSIDTVKSIAKDTISDNRISAITITDNPGGNPRLSPDVLGKEIIDMGMDVIVHFTCRDINRVGMESRALQLASMGMKNILALTGDYSGKGFGGQGAPVFDLDSVNLICMLNMLKDRARTDKDSKGFFTGCAVSPFKDSEPETYAQYYKLCNKISAGAEFVITQLGFDIKKFQELVSFQKKFGFAVPTIGSVYLLSPKAARIMNKGFIPGAFVSDDLLKKIEDEWRDPVKGHLASIKRAASLSAILKGLGYKGIHLGGINKNFEIAAQIIDMVEKIGDEWHELIPDFNFNNEKTYYIFKRKNKPLYIKEMADKKSITTISDRLFLHSLRFIHYLFFNFQIPFENLYKSICKFIDKKNWRRSIINFLELQIKRPMLSCQHCGDCGIQHTGFLCPESKCPKHTRNGPCGGSRKNMCEVRPENVCMWVSVYNRLSVLQKTHTIAGGCVPPRMWELNQTSSWLNFHLCRDHQSASNVIANTCSISVCKMPEIKEVNNP